jgi:S-DNA-T family DNA segregation ATPase FtsK/SpoIIIE
MHRVVSTVPGASTVSEGIRRVHRPPRFMTPPAVAEIEFPRRPAKPERTRLPLIAALVPMLLSVLLSVVLRSPVMMLFALLTPAMLLGQGWSDRRQGRVSHRRRLVEHARELRQAESALRVALEREHTERHTEAPDLAMVGAVVGARDTRLWERRPVDRDHLALRLGVGPQRPRTRVAGDPADCPPLPSLDVPVVVRLGDVGVLGLAGPRDRCLAMARSLITQLCSWHPPRDVHLVLLTGDSAADEAWGWTTLLPHLTPLASNSVAAIGDLGHEGSVPRRVSELAHLVASRKECTAPAEARSDLVVVIDGSERIRREPGVAELLRDGPGVRTHFICLDRDPTRLPVEATARVVLGAAARAEARLDLSDGACATFIPDLPGRTWAEGVARALAPLEDTTPLEDGPVLPDRIDFVEAHHLSGTSGDPLDADDIARSWAEADGRPVAVLGAGDDGAVLVDLVRDGPHALVGGTTGAGKSELLQTLVASLAVHLPPDELTFVLVDYKGGSAFRDCADLPHVLGIVTDLDEHLTARALTSLRAELKRRERLLGDAGAKSFDDYRRCAAQGHEPLARLVLVVDEFKVLAEDLPDFVSGLVRLAAVGRSLGVHLVLATQRPAGIISADMRANVSMRIALRVRDRADSEDVIEGPDAAHIPDRLPGRAYLRTGSRRLILVQVAHAGGAPSAAANGVRRHLPLVRAVEWRHWLEPLPEPSTDPPGTSGDTTLRRVATALTEASRVAGRSRPPSPWLPPLPELLAASDDRLHPDSPTDRAVSIGLVDRPSEQRQTVLRWDPGRDGHLGIAGGARSGRTTALVAVALRLAGRFTPAELHLHALQGHPGSLDCLAALPQCGSITGIDDAQRLRRAVGRLAETQQRPERLTVVLIDGWETITGALEELDQGETSERLLTLARDGLSRGIHVIVTGGRAVASGRLGSLLQRRLLLDMPDPTDLTLAGISPAVANCRRPPGRALDVRDEAQVQLSLPGDDRAADHAALARGVADAVDRRHGPFPESDLPWRLLPLPEHVSVEQLAATPERLVVGVGGDDHVPVGFDLTRDERRVLVLGPPRTGKSTLLRTLMTQLLPAGYEVAAIAPRRSPLAGLPPRPGLHLLRPDEDDRFIALRRQRGDLAVLVDDCDCLDGTPMETALIEATRLVEHSGGLVAAVLDTRRSATAFRGLAPAVGRAGTGVILCPSGPTDGDLLRTRVEPQSVRLPGRGVLVTDGVATPVQVATSATQIACPARRPLDNA